MAISAQRTILCFLFQFYVSPSFLKVIQQLLTVSSASSYHFCPSSYLSFNNVYQTAVPRQDATNPPFVNKYRKVQDIFYILIPYKSSQREEQSLNTFEKRCRKKN